MNRSAIFVALSLLLATEGFALDPSRAVTQYGHDVWQVEEGLPNSAVYAITQTKDGYLWVGTQDGLARFDGVRFRIFDKGNTRAIQDWIWALEPDPDGSLWIGTYSGLVHEHNQTFTLYTRANGLAGDRILSLCMDRNRNLWIGTPEGLSRFYNGRFQNYTTADGLAANAVVALEQDRQGRIWIGTNMGLNSFENGRFLTYTTKDGLADDSIITLQPAADGTLWIATNNGLSHYQNGTFTSYTTRDGLAGNVTVSLLQDRNGNLWVGTYGNGLNRYNQDGFVTYLPQDGLTSKFVRSLFEDSEGNVWLGTDSGLERFKDTHLTTFSMPEGLPHDLVHTIIEDSRHTLWIGTEGGVCRFEQGRIMTFRNLGNVPLDPVYAMAADHTGRVWLGMQNGGVSVYKDGKFINFSTKDGLLNSSVFSIYEDPGGDILLGPFRGGLNVFRNGKITLYRSTDDVPKSALALHRDRSGNLWVGTNSGGLIRFAPDGSKHTYTREDGLSSNMIYVIYEDQDENLWIGTSGGLTLIRQGRVIQIEPGGKLPDTVIYAIEQDLQDHLWMSCNKGIFRISRAQLLDYAMGKAESLDLVLFAKDDGMKTRECTGGTQPSSWKTSEGLLWFATTRGAVRVDPRNLASDPNPPPVILEEVIADGKATDMLSKPAAALVFPPGGENLEFHYTGLSLAEPGRVRFRYRLEPFDADWIDAGHRRTAYYTKIPPGEYVFRVVAANGDGLWNEKGSVLRFTLKPRFHQTRTFYALVLIGLGIAIWGIYRLRVLQMQARFRAVLDERSRISRELHDSVNQGLTGVSLQLEGILQNPESAALSTQLSTAAQMVRMTLAESRRLIQDLRPAMLMEHDLQSALSLTAAQLVAGTTIEQSITVKGTPYPLPQQVEDNLLRIAQEAVTNAVRHAGARKILIVLEYAGKQVRMKIADDGNGFDPTAPGEPGHYGLLGMRERTEDLDGRLSITGGPGLGTTVEVIIPGKDSGLP